MIIQYASDLHIEFPSNLEYLKSNPLKPKGDILILAGDIVPFAVIDKYQDFFSYLSDNFKSTYWIPGNHEYYHSDFVERGGVINEKIRNNVTLINNTAIDQEGVNFIFSTLWSRISPAYQWQIERQISDFRAIKFNGFRFSSERFNKLHADCISFIESELKNNEHKKKVVVTHHVPTYQNYPEKYRGDALSEAFAVELFDTMHSVGPDLWIFGHHHCNLDSFRIGKTTLLTNQLGYVDYKEHFGFNSQKVFQL